MDLTPEERHELDAATTYYQVYVLQRSIPPTEAPNGPTHVQWLWRWNNENAQWENYNGNGTAPTDTYQPTLTQEQFDRLVNGAPIQPDYVSPILPENQGQIVGTDATIENIQRGYFMWNGTYTTTAIAPTTEWQNIPLNPISATSRRNNYDIVHKANE